jgi:hypothetical protein
VKGARKREDGDLVPSTPCGGRVREGGVRPFPASTSTPEPACPRR